ncbi:hypothetical protein MAR_018851 [Mya arenaria]|uniref:Uncharacterized protein n=1 Tax=Mya arenaria TaxID=6604 RepID=A0ABY7EFU8_MYAAR|nr:hypothetical protein MAR_018851 [Mya arenaria]
MTNSLNIDDSFKRKKIVLFIITIVSTLNENTCGDNNLNILELGIAACKHIEMIKLKIVSKYL